MKKTLLILAAATLALSAFAQTPSPSIQPSLVTPTPPAGLSGGYGVNASTPACYHFFIPYTAIKSASGASAQFLLFTTEAGRATIIETVYTRASQGIQGPGIVAAAAQVQTATNNYGGSHNAQQTESAAGGQIMYQFATGGAVEAGAVPVYLTISTTGANLSAATQGGVDVFITRTILQ